MKKEMFNKLLESLDKLNENQKSELLNKLFRIIKDKECIFTDIYWDDYEIVRFCNRNADLSEVHDKKTFLSSVGFDYYKTKEEFMEYMSELYDYLY